MFRYFTGVLLIAAVVSCGKKKLDTPEAALEAVQNAYLKRDAKAFTAVLSKETLNDLEEKVDEMRKMFQNMPENDNAKQAFEHMAKQMGMPVSKLKELTVEDFIGYMMNNEGASGSETTLLPKEMLPPAKVMKWPAEKTSRSFDTSTRYVFDAGHRGKRRSRFAKCERDMSIPTTTGGSMTKAELVEEVSRVSDLTKKHSEVIVDTVFKSIIDALHRSLTEDEPLPE